LDAWLLPGSTGQPDPGRDQVQQADGTVIVPLPAGFAETQLRARAPGSAAIGGFFGTQPPF
jgi:hypothetical protein